jgi:hypothetical protein
MATAAEYKQWLDANASQAGTPDYNTVMEAYSAAVGEEEGIEPGKPLQVTVSPVAPEATETQPRNTSSDYATWLENNKALQGTEQYNIVAAAFEEAKAEEAAAGPEPDTTLEGAGGAIVRGLAPVATGALLGGAIGGPAGAAAGAGAGALTSMVGDPIVSAVNKAFGTNLTQPTEALSALLTSIGVPEPQTALERVLQSSAGAAGGGAGMIGLGRTLMAQAPGAVRSLGAGVGEALAAQPGAQLAGGAAAGTGAQLMAEAGGGPVAQTVGGLAAGLAGGRMVPSGARSPLPPEIAQAERAGIPVMTSDIMPPRTFVGRAVQATGERIPMAGTGAVREAQQEARIASVRDIVNDYNAIDGNLLPEKLMADLAAQRASTIQKYSSNKMDVVERLSGAGNVPMANTIKKIDEEIAKLRRAKTEERDQAAAALEQIKNEIQNRNLFELEAYRRDVLSNVFKDDPARPISIAVREAGEKALRAIYDPVRQDMGNFIRQAGQRRDFEKWMIANKRLSEEANELSKNALKSVFRQGTATPEVVENLLFSAKRSDVAALYRNLSPQGRAVARQAIIARAAKKAETATMEGDVISPDKFANEIKKNANQVGIFFTGDELARIEGLRRILNLTKRASEAAAFPVTGVQNVLPTAAIGGAGLASAFGGGVTGFLAALSAAGGIGAAARIYESAPVRNVLLQASKTNNSDKLIELSKRLAATVQADVTQPNEDGQ